MKSTSPADNEFLRRHFVAVTTLEYDDATLDPLPGGADEVAALRGWLCDETLADRRFTTQYPELASNPTKQQVHEALEDPLAAIRWRRTDVAVLFVSGHGIDDGSAHFVVLEGRDTSRPHPAALKTRNMVAWLTETKIERLLHPHGHVLRRPGGDRYVRLARQFPDTWLVLASATNDPAGPGGLLLRSPVS